MPGEAVGAARLPVPPLLSRERSTWVAVAAAVVAAVGVVVWAFATQPAAGRGVAVALGSGIVVLAGYVAGRRVWVDTARGAVVRTVWGVPVRTDALADAAELRVVGNRGGQALLRVRGSGRRTATHLPLAAADLGGERCQPPGLLRDLAEQVERWAPGSGDVAGLLRAQADHVAAGGSLATSPLAACLTLGRAG